MRIVFVLAAIGFAAGAIVHLIALVHPAVLEPSPAWRHALFVLINAAFAVGMLRRPRGFIVAFAILCAQQLVSHGAQGLHVWQRDHRIDWPSAIVIALLPLVLAALVRERASESRSAIEERAP